MLLADYVYQDRETGKKIIAGVFDRVAVRKRKPPADPQAAVPMNDVRQVGSPYAYISLREVRGRIPLEFRLISLDTNEVLFRAARIEVACDDPLTTVELVLPVPPLPRVPGHYVLELLYENELIGSHRVTVQEVE
jgi:hypothetical protein